MDSGNGCFLEDQKSLYILVWHIWQLRSKFPHAVTWFLSKPSQISGVLSILSKQAWGIYSLKITTFIRIRTVSGLGIILATRNIPGSCNICHLYEPTAAGIRYIRVLEFDILCAFAFIFSFFHLDIRTTTKLTLTSQPQAISLVRVVYHRPLSLTTLNNVMVMVHELVCIQFHIWPLTKFLFFKLKVTTPHIIYVLLGAFTVFVCSCYLNNLIKTH